jgi:hypothetical protein
MKAAAESQQTAPQTQENKIQIQLEPEKFAPLQVQNKKISIVFGSSQENTTTSFDIKTEEPKTQSKFKVYLGNIPVCRLCQRKFKDDYSIEMHEKFSKLHKVIYKFFHPELLGKSSKIEAKRVSCLVFGVYKIMYL